MMRSLFSAVAGLRTHQTKMDVIGDNIANVNTLSFKRSSVAFKDVYYQSLSGGSAGALAAGGTNPRQIGLGVSMAGTTVSHNQGAALSTGNGTDLMIQGDGFFQVQDSAGNIYYTRAGCFTFDNFGNLVTPDGLMLRGVNGVINIATINTAQSYSIDKYGNVSYVNAAGVTQPADQIQLAKFANPAGLLKVGQNLYRATASSGAASPGVPGNSGAGLANTTLIPSSLEMSNVDLAQEFSEMIVTQRGFQANSRTITTSDEMLEELVNLKR